MSSGPVLFHLSSQLRNPNRFCAYLETLIIWHLSHLVTLIDLDSVEFYSPSTKANLTSERPSITSTCDLLPAEDSLDLLCVTGGQGGRCWGTKLVLHPARNLCPLSEEESQEAGSSRDGDMALDTDHPVLQRRLYFREAAEKVRSAQHSADFCGRFEIGYDPSISHPLIPKLIAYADLDTPSSTRRHCIPSPTFLLHHVIPSHFDTTHEIAKRSHPAPLLTRPPPPAASRVDSKSTTGRQQDPLPEYRNMRELRGALQDCISEVIDLRSQLVNELQMSTPT